MYALIIHLLTSVSLLAPAVPAEPYAAPSVTKKQKQKKNKKKKKNKKNKKNKQAKKKNVPKTDVKFKDLSKVKAKVIERTFVRDAGTKAAFDKLVSDDYEELSCWSHPGNIGCWVGDWLVSCEKNANTNDEWNCGATHADDL